MTLNKMKMKTKPVEEEKNNKKDVTKVHLSGLGGGQKVKLVSAEITEESTEKTEKTETKKSGGRKIVEKVRGKKYIEAKKKFDNSKVYDVESAIKWVKETSYSKFDGTVELHMSVKKTGLSANITLPHQAGKQKKVEIASDETIEKLKTGKIDFDILVASTAMMPKLVPFARILGPKGLMPNPKNGTLVASDAKAKSYSTGSVTLKTEKEAPLVHTVIGKVSQEAKELAANLEAILKAFGGGKQIEKAFIKATMGPSIKVQL